ALHEQLRQRILILDGAMGTMIQSYKLNEQAYRGLRFAEHASDLKGNNDLLCLTQPQIISEIHEAYLAAGADIVETNTFNSTAVSQADYNLEELVFELNYAAARLARQAADKFSEHTPEKPRFVAGVLGPTSRTCSISPDVNDPTVRNITFNQLVAVYKVDVNGLVIVCSVIIVIETVFDTLNGKAAVFAIFGYFENNACKLPSMITGTIADASCRTLPGQTTEAFYNSL